MPRPAASACGRNRPSPNKPARPPSRRAPRTSFRCGKRPKRQITSRLAWAWLSENCQTGLRCSGASSMALFGDRDDSLQALQMIGPLRMGEGEEIEELVHKGLSGPRNARFESPPRRSSASADRRQTPRGCSGEQAAGELVEQEDQGEAAARRLEPVMRQRAGRGLAHQRRKGPELRVGATAHPPKQHAPVLTPISACERSIGNQKS